MRLGAGRLLGILSLADLALNAQALMGLLKHNNNDVQDAAINILNMLKPEDLEQHAVVLFRLLDADHTLLTNKRAFELFGKLDPTNVAELAKVLVKLLGKVSKLLPFPPVVRLLGRLQPKAVAEHAGAQHGRAARACRPSCAAVQSGCAPLLGARSPLSACCSHLKVV